MFLFSVVPGGRLSSPATSQASGTRYVSETRFMPLFFDAFVPVMGPCLCEPGSPRDGLCSPVGGSPHAYPIAGRVLPTVLHSC